MHKIQKDMTTLFKKLVMKKPISLNHFAALFVFIFALGVGKAWGTTYYYTAFSVKSDNSGKGLVYTPSTVNTNTAPTQDSQYGDSGGVGQSGDTGSSSGTNDYYAWAKAARGYAFDGWTVSSPNDGVSVDNANKAAGAKITVTSNVADDTNTGTATAKWKDDPNSYTVTFGVPVDGSYTVTYSYTTIEDAAFTTGGFNFSMTESSTASSGQITSYKDDAVTVSTEATNFEGWYNNASFTGTALSTAKSYSFTVSGVTSVYAKFKPATKYFGKVNASIAGVQYSMPGGGTIYISDVAGTSGVTFSENAQTAKITTYNNDDTPPASVNQTYYLYAKTNDKRYAFRGWYDNATCTGTPLSTNVSWEYSFAVSSHTEDNPTTKTVYAAFDFNLYYMEVNATASTSSEGLGMVLVRDNNTGTPEYTEYSYESSQFAYAYRLAPTATVYLYAKPKYGYTFDGWYDNPDCSGDAIGTDNPQTYAATGSSTDPMNPTIVPVYAKFVEDATTISITYNLPDQTKGEYTASVLDIEEVDDEYVWTFTEVFTSVGKTANTTQAQHKTEVLRLDATPIAGYGVTSWTIAGSAKTTPSQLYETSATVAGTYGVAFGDAKPFLVSTNSTQYATLADALTAVGSSGQITVVQNAYVTAGTYTIPSGVTLLVPCDAEYTCYKKLKNGSSYASYAAKWTKPTGAYCTLTLATGAHIVLNGDMSVSAKMNWAMGNNGSPSGQYGFLKMCEGSTLTLKSGSNLYAWGYIAGEGTITAESSSHTYEGFQVTGYRGGNATSGMEGNSQKVFPMNQYYIQNIENKITFQSGALEHLFMGVTSGWGNEGASIDFIGGPSSTNTLFLLKSGSTLTKWYDPSKDRQRFELRGNAELDQIVLDVADVSSADYVLPLCNNMDLDIASGTTTINYDVAVFPDVNIRIRQGAQITIKNGANVYVYDESEWNPAYAYAPFKNNDKNTQGAVTFTNVVRPIGYTTTTKYSRTSVTDANIVIEGTLNIASGGNLYTTASGANITGGDGGTIILGGNAPGNGVTYQAVQSTTGDANTIHHYDAINTTPAKLRNADDSYTLTAGSVAGDQFIYSKNLGKWLKNPKIVTWNANGGTTDASAIAYSEGAFLGELPAAYKDGYTLAGWFTAASGGTQIAQTTKVTANTTYYAHWTPKTYTITYMDEGKVPFSGTHVDSPNAHPTTHTYGTATTLNSATKTGDTFGGWYTVSSCRDGTEISTIGATAITKDITLYAKWINKTLAISASPAEYGSVSHTSLSVPVGSTITSSGNSFTVNGSTTVTATPIPSTAAYTYAFERWHNLPATVTKSVSILAVFSGKANVASVTAGGVTTYHTTLEDAISTANGKTGATVTMQQNVSVASEITISAAMTIDLNGKTITSTQAAATTGVFKINASGKTITIRDGGSSGKIVHTASVNGHIYGLHLTAGSLTIAGGTIYAENTAASNNSYRA